MPNSDYDREHGQRVGRSSRTSCCGVSYLRPFYRMFVNVKLLYNYSISVCSIPYGTLWTLEEADISSKTSQQRRTRFKGGRFLCVHVWVHSKSKLPWEDGLDKECCNNPVWHLIRLNGAQRQSEGLWRNMKSRASPKSADHLLHTCVRIAKHSAPYSLNTA